MQIIFVGFAILCVGIALGMFIVLLQKKPFVHVDPVVDAALNVESVGVERDDQRVRDKVIDKERVKVKVIEKKSSVESFYTASLGESDLEIDSLSLRDALAAKGILTSRHSPLLLKRFLAARQYNLDLAVAMASEIEEWRRNYLVDDLINFKFPERPIVEKYFPQYLHGQDLQKRPIQILEFDKMDYAKIIGVNGTTKDRFIKFCVRRNEELEWKLQYCFEANANSSGQILLIVNIKKAPLYQFSQMAGLLRETFNILGSNYPDIVGQVFIVNAPYLFTAIWRVMSGWLDPATVAKVQLLGNNLEKLVSVAGASNLPRKYGGTCVCKGGCEKSDLGIWQNSIDYKKWQSVLINDIA
jgi:hypothetical protein